MAEVFVHLRHVHFIQGYYIFAVEFFFIAARLFFLLFLLFVEFKNSTDYFVGRMAAVVVGHGIEHNAQTHTLVQCIKTLLDLAIYVILLI